MDRVVKELARQAAAAARAEREAAAAVRTERGAAAQVPLLVRTYRGVRERNGRYAAEVRIPAENSRRLWLDVYETAEEAAHAYDAAERKVQGHRAKLNFPEISAPRAEVEDDVAAAAVLTHLAQVRRDLEAVPLYSQQTVAPVAAPTPRASFFHWAPPPAAPAAAPHLPSVPYRRALYSTSNSISTSLIPCAAYGAAFHTGSSVLGTYVAPVPDEPMANCPGSSAQSRSDPILACRGMALLGLHSEEQKNQSK